MACYYSARKESVLERLGLTGSFDTGSVLEGASEASIVAEKDTEWFSETFQGMIEDDSNSDIDDLSPDNISVPRE